MFCTEPVNTTMSLAFNLVASPVVIFEFVVLSLVATFVFTKSYTALLPAVVSFVEAEFIFS